MKYAFHTALYPNATYRKIAELARNAGAVAIRLDNCGSAFGLPRASMPHAAAHFRQKGLKITHLITTLNFEGYEPEKIQEGKKALELSAMLGADAIAVTLGSPMIHRGDDKDFDHMGIVRSVRELCFYAKELGQALWVTPCNNYTSGISLVALLDAVAMDNLGFAWNILRSAEQLSDLGELTVFARNRACRIRHVSIEDGTPNGDKDILAYDPRPVGKGDLPIGNVVRELLEAGFTGYFSCGSDSWENFRNYMDGICLDRVEIDPAMQLMYPMPEILPPAGHPRVYFRQDHLPMLRENAKHPENRMAGERFAAQAGRPTDDRWGILASENGKIQFPKESLWDVEAKAFCYALYGDETKGEEAILFMRNLCRTADPTQWDYNRNGLVVYTLGVVYDWCYPLLTEEDKAAFHDGVIAHGQSMEIGYPPVKQNAFSGHGPEAQLMRDLMCAGIAMFDEYPNIYQNTAGRFFKEFVHTRQYLYRMHCFHEGNHYFSYRMQWDMLCTWLFHRMGYPKIFGQEQLETLRHYLYVHRPDGAVLENGNTNNREKIPGKYFTNYHRVFFLGGNYWRDPYLKEAALEMLRMELPEDAHGNQTLTPVEFLLFNDPGLEGKPRSQLPLLHYQPSPKGGLLVHTDWTDGIDSPDVICELKINEYWHVGHQHLDAGAFQIYYKGLLASDDGYYQSWMEERCADRENNGYTGFGSLHHYNYTRRTIAHNCMLVYDPDERFRDERHKVHANDGGQRIARRGCAPASVEELLDPANGYRCGTELAHGWGPDAANPDYAYLKGDLAAAYSQKVEAYERSFLFLNLKNKQHPAALLVFDRVVAAKPEFKKTWLCHGLSQPQICGNRAVFRNTQTVPGTGIYAGCYNGKLTVDTLLPAQAAVTAVGGPGREHMVDGVNYFAKVGPDQRQEGHGWRLEVSPKNENREDYFLHVLQVGDADGPEALPITLIDTNTHAGAVMQDIVALFRKERDRTSQPVCFAFEGIGTYTVLVADLAPGHWQIICNGIPAGHTEADEISGLAEFIGKPGIYEIRRML